MVSKTQIIGQSLACEETRPEPGAGSSSEPAAPIAQDETGVATEGKLPIDPTRYGDWEKNGRCIDF
jgi:hypothetical protein